MLADPDYIEQLILEEITGTISPEDSITLKKILEVDPDVRALRALLHRQLTGTHIQSVREDFPNTLTSSQIITTARRRKRHKRMVFTTVTGSVALLVGVIVVYKILFPASQPVTPRSISLSALKSVVLQLPDGNYYQLGSGQQQFKAYGISFREVGGKLSCSGGGRESQFATLIVPPGKDYTLGLPDGTAVSVNAATRVQFPLDFDRKRELRIEGEAYLQVAQHRGIPFTVHLPNSTVQVLGTSFNVNTYDSTRDQVLLETGAIRMHTKDGDLLLRPGQGVDYQPGKLPLTIDIDTAAVLSWKQGYYTFAKTPVAVVSKVLERNYGISVILDSKETGNRIYNSRLEKDEPLKAFLDRLKVIDNIQYQFEKNDSVLHLLYRP
jgi:transmembrane sensor